MTSAGPRIDLSAGMARSPNGPANLAHLLGGAAKPVDLGADGANGLAQLVLTLLNIVQDLLERQAIRRMEGGSLTDAQIELLGSALMRQAQTIADLCRQFGIDETDLVIDLGPLGQVGGDNF
jgi:hypothetical protein